MYLFSQDDCRITHRVTLSLGLRYSVFQPFGITGGRADTFRAGQQSAINPGAPPGMVFPGDTGVPSALAACNFDRSSSTLLTIRTSVQPDSSYADLATTFGKITTASDPRILQFALRYQF